MNWELVFAALIRLFPESHPFRDRLQEIDESDMTDEEKCQAGIVDCAGWFDRKSFVTVDGLAFGPYSTIREAELWVNLMKGDVDKLKYAIRPLQQR